MKPTPRKGMPVWLWLILGTFLLLIVAAALHEVSRGGAGAPAQLAAPPAEEVLSALRSLGAAHVTATNGLFSLPAPAGWQVKSGQDAEPYDVVFFTPNGASISAMAAQVAYNDLPTLDRTIRKKEYSRDLSTALDAIRLGDRAVIQRKATLLNQRVLAVDFVQDYVAYHVMCAAPLELYDVYEPLFHAVAKGLRARPAVTPAADDSQTHAVDTPDTP